MPSQEDHVLLIEQVGEVSMSLQHAKKIAAILQGQIDVYERGVGLIAQPNED